MLIRAIIKFPFFAAFIFSWPSFGPSSQLSVAYFLSLSLSPFHFLLNPRQQSQLGVWQCLPGACGLAQLGSCY